MYYKNSNGAEKRNEYDAFGNQIYYYDSLYGTKWWMEYDSNSNLIHEKTSDGSEFWYEYIYRQDGTIDVVYKYKPA